MKDFFKNNMLKLKNELKDNEMIILSSGDIIKYSSDSSYTFRVNKNFYYYTGIEFDGINLVIYKRDGQITQKIFFDEISKNMVKWIGEKLTKEKVKELFDIKDEFIKSSGDFVKEVKKDISINEIQTIYLDNSIQKILELNNIVKQTSSEKLINFLNVDLISEKHRPFKKEVEIELTNQAINYTNKAIHMIMKNLKTCKQENEIEAYYDFSLRKNGIKNKSFDSIVASGNNATILHYDKNNSDLNSNDLVLLDLGIEYKGYSSDISRTLPLSGKYNDKQRKYYEIVLNTNKYICENIKIGMTFKELNQLAKDYLAQSCLEIGLIKEPQEIEKYYYHSVSHPLGLDAHDIRPSDGIIRENMIITVEPGLYVEEDGIGIRIEDDVLVKENKNIVLSSSIPKEIDEIEELLNY